MSATAAEPTPAAAPAAEIPKWERYALELLEHVPEHRDELVRLIRAELEGQREKHARELLEAKTAAAEAEGAAATLEAIAEAVGGIAGRNGGKTKTTPENVLEHVRLLKEVNAEAVAERQELSSAWRKLSKALG